MKKRYWWTAVDKSNKVDLRAALLDIANKNVHFSLYVFDGELMIFHKDCKLEETEGGVYITGFLPNQYCRLGWRFFNKCLTTFDYKIEILTDEEFKKGYD